METLERRDLFSVAPILEPLLTSQVIGDIRPAIVTVDDPANHEIAAGGGFDGVAHLAVFPYSHRFLAGRCTASLLEDGRHVLTAAHCLTGDSEIVRFGKPEIVRFDDAELEFTLADQVVEAQPIGYIVHPDWNGDAGAGNDIAILVLEKAVPEEVERYDLYRESDELGRDFTLVGYGLPGQGETGQEESTLVKKRSGENRYEAFLDEADTILVYDFDNGKPANDALGYHLGLHNLGLGNHEAKAAQGDSGGPTFIDGKLAGITSFGAGLPPTDVTVGTDASFGEFSFDTRVSAFADWIDDQRVQPTLFVDGVHGAPALTNDTLVQLSFVNVPEDAEFVRFAVNGTQYGDWQDYASTTSITIPRYVGDNFINAEIKRSEANDEVIHLWQRVFYAKPAMKVNDGATSTNQRQVRLTFENVASQATRIRFAVNGHNYGPWLEFYDHEPRLLSLPAHYGANYINAQLEYEDETVSYLWQKIELAKPVLKLNDGATQTSTRDVRVSFDNLAPNVKQVRFAINGFDYDEWQSPESSTSVQLPDFAGTNYVNAIIQYEDGSETFVWNKIKYVPTALELNRGLSSTNHQEISLTFSTLDDAPQSMRVAVNGFAYGKWQQFDAETTIRLPDYYGINYVNVELKFAEGRVARVWQKIELVAPGLAVNGGSPSTNSKDVQVSLENIVGQPERIRFAVNGFDYASWQAYEGTAMLALPGYVGTNYVNAEIEFAEGQRVHVWDRIDYEPMPGRSLPTTRLNSMRFVENHSQHLGSRALVSARETSAALTSGNGIWVPSQSEVWAPIGTSCGGNRLVVTSTEYALPTASKHAAEDPTLSLSRAAETVVDKVNHRYQASVDEFFAQTAVFDDDLIELSLLQDMT